MSGAHQLIVDPGRIVHETIADETIVIDLDTGTYYRLSGAGPEIWALLVAGHPPDAVVATMQQRYATDPQPVASLTADLIERLCRDALLTEGELPAGTAPAAPPGGSEDGAGFAPPVLEPFTDMQYFLMLDPIHEVYDGGWPHAPAPPQDAA